VLTTPKGRQSLAHGKTAMIRLPRGRRGQGERTLRSSATDERCRRRSDDYAGLDVRGKMVVVLFGSPKGMDSEIGAHLRSEQGRVAADHGAVGMLAVQTRATAAVLPWKVVVSIFAEPATTWATSDGTPFDPSHGLKAGAIIEPATSAALFEGSGRTRRKSWTKRTSQEGARRACTQDACGHHRCHQSAPVLES
jgi:hypothetical protein